MTTDPFTEAAIQHFYETYDIARLPMPGTLALEMAEWARTHLAAQEPTEGEVLAALNAWIGGLDYIGPLSLDDYDESEVRDMSVALSAARAARRDEEKR